MLTTRYENLCMLDNEILSEFYAKLGEKFSNAKLVKKKNH